MRRIPVIPLLLLFALGGGGCVRAFDDAARLTAYSAKEMETALAFLDAAADDVPAADAEELTGKLEADVSAGRSGRQTRVSITQFARVRIAPERWPAVQQRMTPIALPERLPDAPRWWRETFGPRWASTYYLPDGWEDRWEGFAATMAGSNTLFIYATGTRTIDQRMGRTRVTIRREADVPDR